MNGEFTPLVLHCIMITCPKYVVYHGNTINIYVLIRVPGVCYVSYNCTVYMAFMTVLLAWSIQPLSSEHLMWNLLLTACRRQSLVSLTALTYSLQLIGGYMYMLLIHSVHSVYLKYSLYFLCRGKAMKKTILALLLLLGVVTFTPGILHMLFSLSMHTNSGKALISCARKYAYRS